MLCVFVGTFDVISWDDIGQSVINTTVVPVSITSHMT